MIYVDENILEGLEACRNSGYCNMFDYRSVVFWLMEHDYPKAAAWVAENSHEEYTKGIFEGFELA